MKSQNSRPIKKKITTIDAFKPLKLIFSPGPYLDIGSPGPQLNWRGRAQNGAIGQPKPWPSCWRAGRTGTPPLPNERSACWTLPTLPPPIGVGLHICTTVGEPRVGGFVVPLDADTHAFGYERNATRRPAA